MIRARRRTAMLVSAALALLGAGSATTAANAAAAGCQVQYTINNEVNGDFTAAVQVANVGPKLKRWTLTWNFVPGQEVGEASGATVHQRGTAVRAAGRSAVATGGTVTFGFTGSWTATNPAPPAFALNGTACTTTVVPGTTADDDAAVECPPSPSSTSGRVAATPIKIWMAGDSTMQNPSGGVCPVGWGSQFGALFTSDATVVNRSVGGR